MRRIASKARGAARRSIMAARNPADRKRINRISVERTCKHTQTQAAASYEQRTFDLACYQFRGHEDNIMTKDLGVDTKRRKFSRKFNTEAVKPATKRGVTVAQACRDLELAGSVLRRWMREAAEAQSSAFPGKGQQRAELAETAALKNEVAKLKAERDIPKKGETIFRH